MLSRVIAALSIATVTTILSATINVHANANGSVDSSKADQFGDADLRCGSNCLYLAIRALDVPIKNAEQVEIQLGQPGRSGYSIADLAEGAQTLGLHSIAVQTSLESLESRSGRFGCIALLKNNHYVNIYDIDSDSVYLIDPPSTRKVGRRAFSLLWTGKALIVSKERIVPMGRRSNIALVLCLVTAASLGVALILFAVARLRQSPTRRSLTCLVLLLVGLTGGCKRSVQEGTSLPILGFEPKVLDLGELEPSGNAAVVGSFYLKNLGSADLEVHSVQSSCGCTIVKTPRVNLAPGRGDRLLFELKPGIQAGPRSSTLAVVSNDPNKPVTSLPIRWISRPLASFDLQQIDFGMVAPGANLEKVVTLLMSEKILVGKWSLTTDSPM